ncbi:glycerophosphodiester phosphodiesterase family protein [Streptomyces virginiae]|uniref:glycerophosphodiester phosphodiesterase n=1 Tax=Streptomyces TaxID=1883 RepID=UPI0006B042D7|nr:MULTISPECIES: glycerophosphodiester phosphodiesterase family protein [unclassified Streptomyces]KOU66514.1 glycerophosphodiester phosphodiesterase [Streptomyces sp. IGB124]KOU74987.1 glycerophosphodiester phosphodiesterase [Streptomyces sp. XY66]KOU80015.1 glycerophosphodiester phosphodiesterase [Streptomyces sp. XY58]KOV03733.1 glycerophosphodiester phosphodiesterase [Streptomyces sp. XY37]KOV14058.1 glycerophosphodiester phosphodiesterase [Streptomyces sp. XY413]
MTHTQLRTDRAVRVVAHRGASHEHPEHTLAAYRQAIADGADALECDVRLTADHKLVCVHDRRVERTSDGRGVVSEMTYEELSALDFGRWKGEEHRGAQVLLFEDLLKEALAADRPVGLAVETKHPTRAGGRLEAELVRVLKDHGLADGSAGLVEVMSFSRNALIRLNRLAPGLPAVYLIERRLRPARPPFAGHAGPGIDLVRKDPGLVARLKAKGLRVRVWTVDEPEDVELCLRLGVDTLITNRPREVRAQLEAE